MVKYRDKKLGWIVYPVVALSFTFFANDNDIRILVRLPSFKWDVLFSLFAVSVVGFYLAWLSRYLDKHEKFSWLTATKTRLYLQTLYGILIPLLFSIGLEALYLMWIEVPLSESSILNLELPLAFNFLFLINLLYYLNFVIYSKQQQSDEPANANLEQERIVISQGAKEVLLPLEKIAFIRSFEKHTWLHTCEQNQSILDGTLNDWEKKLPKEQFYRLNRKYIAHRNTVRSTEHTETRRLKVFLIDWQDEVFVPKIKATDFKRWLKS